MKLPNLIYLLFFIPVLSIAQSNHDTVLKKRVVTFVEMEPAFPGGIQEFFQYIQSNLHYPELAELLGINGKVIVDFTVDKTGKLVEITSQKSLGAGCEYEAAKVVSMSPKWRPGIQNGHPISVHYNVEVNFNKTKKKISFKELNESHYGFVFRLKDSIYNIEEAQARLGNAFRQDKLLGTELFYNPDNIQKFNLPNKKEVYLLKIKS